MIFSVHLECVCCIHDFKDNFVMTHQGKDGKQAENMIYSVLRQRHTKEAIHLEEQLANEREAALRRARGDVEKQVGSCVCARLLSKKGCHISFSMWIT